VANLVEDALLEEFPDEELRKSKVDRIARVVNLIKLTEGSTAAECAAMLCEVMDCALISPTKIEEMFGSDLRRLVDELTEPETEDVIPPQFGDRTIEEWRIAKQAKIISGASPSAKFVRLAQEAILLEDIASIPREDEISANLKAHIVGALQFVSACRGVSPALEQFMLDAYTEAYKIHCQRK
jgi:(p)ppGpp synthase/HD superfamily hydrolase